LYGTPQEKITVTPLAPDPDFRPAGEHDSFLLFVSAIEPRKQPLDAIDAANAVGRELIVVGPPKDAELAAELTRRGADVRGYVPKEELVRLYQSAAALVFPSRYEGFGLPVVEAMACGTPVLASDLPALREVGGPATTYCPVGDVDRWTLAASRLLDERANDAARWRMRQAEGIAWARRFDWRAHARTTTDVYREMLAAVASDNGRSAAQT